MESIVPSSSTKTLSATEQTDQLRHFSPEARAAFYRFKNDGDTSGLDVVICAILGDFMPSRPSVPLAERPGSTLLINDLGFDSLAITEVVFFAEDLFGISISNAEIVGVRTLDDLRRFIRHKVALRTAR
jgi:acyl carrier protein